MGRGALLLLQAGAAVTRVEADTGRREAELPTYDLD